jgi:hypothetical protein
MIVALPNLIPRPLAGEVAERSDAGEGLSTRPLSGLTSFVHLSRKRARNGLTQT